MCNYLCINRTINKKNCVYHYINSTNQLPFKKFFEHVEQHTGGNSLIHGTKHHKGNQGQNVELRCKNILVVNITLL